MGISNTISLTATGVYKIASANQGTGAGGWYLIFTGTGWTGSVILAQDLNAPGSVSLPIGSASVTSVAYYDPSNGNTVSAGTAITATGNWQVASVGWDLYLNYTHTAGSATVTIQPAAELVTEPVVGTVTAAGNVTRGTFGANVPDTGGFVFPSSLTITTTGLTTGVHTFTAAPVFSSVTASQALEVGAGKALQSAAIVGTGSYVKSISPILTGQASYGGISGAFSGIIGTRGQALAAGRGWAL